MRWHPLTIALSQRDGLLLAAYVQVREVAAMVGIEAGDEMESDPVGDGMLR